MVIDPKFQRPKQRGLAMIAAADDQGDAARKPHSAYCATVRQRQGDLQFFRRAEGDGIRHRQRTDPAGSGQDAACLLYTSRCV